MSPRLRTVGALLGTAVILSIAIAVTRAEGSIRSGIEEFVKSRAMKQEVRERWSEIADGARIDSGLGEVSVVVFTDFECPYCRDHGSLLELLMNRFPERGVVVRHFPNPWSHPQSLAASVAAACAGEQGAFAPMYWRLFGTAQWRLDGDWMREARAVGVPDAAQFRSCTESRETVERIGADWALARQLGLSGTPGYVFSDGTVSNGILSTELEARFSY